MYKRTDVVDRLTNAHLSFWLRSSDVLGYQLCSEFSSCCFNQVVDPTFQFDVAF